MSTGFELIPLVIAIGAAAGAARKRKGGAYALSTRLKDDDLLVSAVEGLGGTSDVRADGIAVTVGELDALFQRPAAEAPFDAVFQDAVPQADAQQLVLDVDAAYGLAVQSLVRERVLAEATGHDLDVESERVEADGTVVLTLRVGA